MLDRTSAAEYLCIGVMGPVSINITFKLRTGAEENLFLSLPGFPQVVPEISSAFTEHSQQKNISKSLEIRSFLPFT